MKTLFFLLYLNPHPNICKKSFIHPLQLNIHIQWQNPNVSTLTKPYTFIQIFCRKSFIHPLHLNIHIQWQKPQCFSSLSTLNTHPNILQKIIHPSIHPSITPERPHSMAETLICLLWLNPKATS